jgi:hypothetical protein
LAASVLAVIALPSWLHHTAPNLYDRDLGGVDSLRSAMPPGLPAAKPPGPTEERVSGPAMSDLYSAKSQPPPRATELVNYFSYNYPQPRGSDPFSLNVEVAGCPWNGEHRLVRIGLKGREVPDERRPPCNLVFLIDVSGSMQPENKLPLLKRALALLMQKLGENERVAIVTYASGVSLALPSTSCENKETILSTLYGLQAGGSTFVPDRP